LRQDVSAIEARKQYYADLDLKDRTAPKLVLDLLTFPPIGETIRNIAVNQFITENLTGA
jgi:hypothetical protein